jgi:hypothetical protein
MLKKSPDAEKAGRKKKHPLHSTSKSGVDLRRQDLNDTKVPTDGSEAA